MDSGISLNINTIIEIEISIDKAGLKDIRVFFRPVTTHHDIYVIFAICM